MNRRGLLKQAGAPLLILSGGYLLHATEKAGCAGVGGEELAGRIEAVSAHAPYALSRDCKFQLLRMLRWMLLLHPSEIAIQGFFYWCRDASAMPRLPSTFPVSLIQLLATATSC